MRLAWAAAVVLGASPLAKPEGPDIPWSEPNGEATYVVTQTAQGRGCHLQVTHDADDAVLWEADGCYGGQGDKKFLSRDGKRLIVIASFPAAPGKQAVGWRTSTVAWLFEKGVLVQSAVAGQFVKEGSEVRRSVSHFEWLQGVDRVPGVPPRYSDKGDAVELDAIDGTHARLAFAGFRLPPPYRSKRQRRRRY